MKSTIARSLTVLALVVGAVFAAPLAASAATSDFPGDATTPATASVTGTVAPVLGYWIGGGALALLGGAAAVGATVRRHRRDLEA